MKLKLDPRLWQYEKVHVAGVDVTHEFDDYSEDVAEQLLRSRKNGIPLVVKAEEEEPKPLRSPKRSRKSSPPAPEVAEPEAESSDDDQ